MAHTTLIDGTAYEISGGKTLIDGTGYGISKGNTLVDGTVHKIPFVVPMYSIATEHKAGSISSGAAYASVSFYSGSYGDTIYVDSVGRAYLGGENGTQVGRDVIFSLPAGTAIICRIRSGSMSGQAYVSINGTKVLKKAAGTASYAYNVDCDATIVLGNNPTYAYGYIEITEN